MEREKITEHLKNGTLKFHTHYSDGNLLSSRNAENMPVHKHAFREMLYVIEGESRFLLNGREHPLSKGSVVLIDSWISHSDGYRQSDQNLTHLWFYFFDNGLSARWCNVSFHGQYTFTGALIQVPSHVHTLFSSRWNELRKQQKVTPEVVTFYLQTPFRCILEELLFQMNPMRKNASESSDIVHSVQLYIETQNARNCSLEHLEKIFGYNRFYLAHRFREVIGMPVGSYINQVRISFTENALLKGLKQKEIAGELGFSSSAAFWKWLQKNKK